MAQMLAAAPFPTAAMDATMRADTNGRREGTE
jgi:hypothetical protein